MVVNLPKNYTTATVDGISSPSGLPHPNIYLANSHGHASASLLQVFLCKRMKRDLKYTYYISISYKGMGKHYQPSKMNRSE